MDRLQNKELKERVSVKLPVELIKDINDFAQARGRTGTEFCRKLIDKRIENEESYGIEKSINKLSLNISRDNLKGLDEQKVLTIRVTNTENLWLEKQAAKFHCQKSDILRFIVLYASDMFRVCTKKRLLEFEMQSIRIECREGQE